MLNTWWVKAAHMPSQESRWLWSKWYGYLGNLRDRHSYHLTNGHTLQGARCLGWKASFGSVQVKTGTKTLDVPIFTSVVDDCHVPVKVDSCSSLSCQILPRQRKPRNLLAFAGFAIPFHIYIFFGRRLNVFAAVPKMSVSHNSKSCSAILWHLNVCQSHLIRVISPLSCIVNDAC